MNSYVSLINNIIIFFASYSEITIGKKQDQGYFEL